jgi:Ca2+-binding RTX toxin-like protein
MAWFAIAEWGIGIARSIGVYGGLTAYGAREYYGTQSDALADANGLLAGSQYSPARNAIGHVYTSGELNGLLGREAATNLGDYNERIGELAGRSPNDSWKDQWNNEVGRRLNEWAENNGYDWYSAKGDLIMDAYNNNQLIIDEDTDPRVDLSTSPTPSWSGPSASWQGSSAGDEVPHQGENDLGWEFSGAIFDPGEWLNSAINPVEDLLGSAAIFLQDLVSPLILDLDGDGIELSSLVNSTAFFDLDADGFHEHTGWVSADDGILAIDSNGNGVIDGIDEVFGNATIDGFVELAALDSNNDGFINVSDASWSDLLVWQDLDGDGWSDSGELNDLTHWGITEIDLNYSQENSTLEGHSISTSSSFTMNGVSHDIKDVWFEHSQIYALERLSDNFDYDQDVFTLPDFHGYGNLSNLWVAMTNDANLKLEVETLVTSTPDFYDANYISSVESILFKWAGVDQVAPNSRGQYIDARVVEALEVMLDDDFSGQFSGGANPNTATATASALNVHWNEIVSKYAARFLNFTANKPLIDGYDAAFAALEAEEAAGNPIADMTQAEVDALLNPILNAAEAAFDAQAIKWAAAIEYDYASDSFTGDLQALIYAIEADQPVGNEALNDFWYGNLPFIHAYANALEIDAQNYQNILETTHLASVADRLAGAIIRIGTSGDDTTIVQNPYSLKTNDFFYGGKGNDYLKGDHIDDTYVFSSGDGDDTVFDQAMVTVHTQNDHIIFTDQQLSDVTFEKNVTGRDLLIHYGQNDQVTVQDFFLGNFGNYEIEHFRFADGSALTSQQVIDLLETPTNGDDVLWGTGAADTLLGGEGNDHIYGLNGVDSILGGAGDDTINGGTAFETLDGGSGFDIVEYDFGHLDINLQIGETRQTGYFNVFEMITDFEGAIRGNGNDTITGSAADNYLEGGFGFDVINANGGNDTVLGGSFADTISLGSGSDIVAFKTIYESYLSAPDYVTDFSVAEDQIDVSTLGYSDISELNITYDANSERTVVTHNDGFTLELANNLNLSSTNFIFFDNNLTITGTASDDSLLGGLGDDSIYGSDGNDTIDGGAGQDRLQGDAGADVFLFSDLTHSVDDGAANNNLYDRITDFNPNEDVIDLQGLGFTTLLTDGSSTSDVTELKLSVSSSGRTYLSNGQNDFSVQIVGDHSATLNSTNLLLDVITGGPAAIEGDATANTLNGTANDEIILGYTADDSLNGNAGNDTLVGGADKDTLTGGDGADIFRFEDLTHSRDDGNLYENLYDRITDFEVGVDKIDLTGLGFDTLVTTSSTASSNEIRVKETTSYTYLSNDQNDFSIQLSGNYASSLTSNDFIWGGGNSVTTLQGGSGADTLSGQAGAEVILGLGANDTLSGGGGKGRDLLALLPLL